MGGGDIKLDVYEAFIAQDSSTLLQAVSPQQDGTPPRFGVKNGWGGDIWGGGDIRLDVYEDAEHASKDGDRRLVSKIRERYFKQYQEHYVCSTDIDLTFSVLSLQLKK